MNAAPPPSANSELPAPGRLNVRLPSNLRLAVTLAAEAARMPVAGFVRLALLERLERDAEAANRAVVRAAAADRLAGALRGEKR